MSEKYEFTAKLIFVTVLILAFLGSITFAGYTSYHIELAKLNCAEIEVSEYSTTNEWLDKRKKMGNNAQLELVTRHRNNEVSF